MFAAGEIRTGFGGSGNGVPPAVRNESTDDRHRRPDGAGDKLVATTGRLSEALEYVERARGALYTAHQLMGHADGMLDEVVAGLRDEGFTELAECIETELVGRNILAGRWTFQVVEEFDDGYYTAFRDLERAVRDATMAGRRHVFEAEMKERRRTHGHPAHTATP